MADSNYVPPQPLLREAFEHYRHAEIEANFDQRARLLLMGNLKCGWHEQTRLQPEIASAMTAPLQTLNDLTRRFVPFLRRPVARFTKLVEELTCLIVTHGFMSLRLPDGTRLELGRDLERAIPPCFADIEHDPFLAQFEGAGSGGDGAENWSNLQQRIEVHRTTIPLLSSRSPADEAAVR